MGQDGQVSHPQPAPGPVSDRVPAHPPLVRPVQGRVIAGVASGLAVHLRLNVGLVRVALLIMALAGGAGVAGYVFLWGFMPEGDQAHPTATGHGSVRGRAEQHRTFEGSPSRREPWSGAQQPILDSSEPTRGASELARGASESTASVSKRTIGRAGWTVIGGLLIVGLGVAAWRGFSIDGSFWLPVVLLAAGAVFAWSQLDSSARRAWMPDDPTRRGWTVVRVIAGVAMAVVGLVLLTTRGRGLADLRDVVIAVLVVLLGVAFIMAPYAARLWRDFRTEQTARIRATERADIAAHLHDSVLQTLTLIQRQSADPGVTRLARAQERELRQWLFAGRNEAGATLGSAITEAAYEVEDRYGIPVDLVVTGDCALDPGTTALVAALREALVNAAVHGARPISAFLEVGPGGVEAFVRDRGTGFDLDLVPSDRKGVRESIIGRMARHGGTAHVRCMDSGTEVGLFLPRLRASVASPVEDAGPSVTVGDRPSATAGDRPSAPTPDVRTPTEHLNEDPDDA